jgi:hypothetical protein
MQSESNKSGFQQFEQAKAQHNLAEAFKLYDEYLHQQIKLKLDLAIPSEEFFSVQIDQIIHPS